MCEKPNLLPKWAVSDESAAELIPESGFIHDYMTYMKGCTDAPLIYHYGVAVTILSSAVSGADILCKDSLAGSKNHYVLPTPIWSALIGISGAARKSSSMSAGIGMLTRAKSIKQQEALLPSDGSLEGWHDFMVDHNEVLLYHDELANMFDQARRGYSEGLKHWMMEIYSGRTKTRSTVKANKEKKGDDEEGNGKTLGKTISRPRLSVLGGIPPDIFVEKSSAMDWQSGFLARFVFWPGDREWFNRKPGSNATKETELARWLNKIACNVGGYIEIPEICSDRLMDWFFNEVETHRRSLAPPFYSHLVRYQDLGLRLIAMHAVARASSAKKIEAVPEDADEAIKALNLLKTAANHLFQDAQKDTERSGEDNLINLLKVSSKPLNQTEISEELSISQATISRRLQTLFKGGVITKKKSSSHTVGMKPWVYSVPR